MNKVDNNDWKRKPTPMPEPKDALIYVETMVEKYVERLENHNDVKVEFHEIDVSFEELLEMSKKDPLSYSALSNLTQTFYRRYYWKQLTNYFTYKKYKEDKEIQQLLDDLELDKEKFWYLILFAYDYSESLCINGIDVAFSAHEQLQTLIKRICQCGVKFNMEDGCTLGKNIKLEAYIEGEKKPIIIDNPNYEYDSIIELYNELKGNCEPLSNSVEILVCDAYKFKNNPDLRFQPEEF